jgi:hypothetical protein
MGEEMTRRYLTAAACRELTERLSQRDWTVLKYVSDLRFVSGAQLARLCFTDDPSDTANARAARRALLRLTRLDVLARLPRPVGGVRAGSAGFVYLLAPGGQRLATARGWQPERRRRRSFTPGRLFVAHALQVAELHTQLTEADRSRRIELLELASEPSCWRAFDGLANQRAVLKPDSYARVGSGPYEDSYFLEVDRGTEGSRAIERQLDLYVAYRATGLEQADRGVFPKVLWLTPTAGRAEVIRASVERLPRHAQELFAVAELTALLDVLGPDDPQDVSTVQNTSQLAKRAVNLTTEADDLRERTI